MKSPVNDDNHFFTKFEMSMLLMSADFKKSRELGR